MLIKSVTLQNFRGYKNPSRIEFEKLTTFVGKNDIGKSTILEALDIFFNEGKAVSPMDKSDLNIQARVDGDSNVVIAVEFCDIPADPIIIDDTNQTTLAAEYLLNKNGYLEIVKSYPNASGTAKCYVKAFHPTNPDCCDLLSKKITDLKKIVENGGMPCVDKTKKAELRKSIWQHYSADLRLQEYEVDMSKEDAKSIMDNLKSLMPIYSLFQSDRNNSDGDKEIQDPLKAAVKAIMQDAQITDWCEKIAEKVSRQLQTVADGTLAKLNEMNNQLAGSLHPQIPQTKDLKWQDVFKTVSITGDNDIAINKRGSGVRRLVLLNFFRAQAEAGMANHSGLIYAIEEPETSQHVEHQKMLVDSLKNMAEQDKVQVVLTTHSPYLVKMMSFGNLRLITDNPEGKDIKEVVPQQLPYPSLNEVNFVAYDELSIEYFNELYGYIEHLGQKQNFFNGKQLYPYIRLNNDGTTKQEQRTKVDIIRQIIHHPENNNNNYSTLELRQAIMDMRTFINSLP